jgi:hypothetical protein
MMGLKKEEEEGRRQVVASGGEDGGRRSHLLVVESLAAGPPMTPPPVDESAAHHLLLLFFFSFCAALPLVPVPLCRRCPSMPSTVTNLSCAASVPPSLAIVIQPVVLSTSSPAAVQLATQPVAVQPFPITAHCMAIDPGCGSGFWGFRSGFSKTRSTLSVHFSPALFFGRLSPPLPLFNCDWQIGCEDKNQGLCISFYFVVLS